MKEKKNKIITIILSISLIITVIGVTYAAFVYTGKGTKENSLTTGTVSFVYNETSNGVSITNAYPMTEEKGKQIQDEGEDITKGYFDFEVKSTLGADTIIPYYVYAVDTTEEKGTELDSEYVKVYLTNQEDVPYEQYNKEIVPVYSELEDIKGTGTDNNETEGKLLYQDTFTESGRKDFRLRLWVSNDYVPTEEVKKFKMRVDVSTDAKVIPKDQNKPTCEIIEKDPQTIGGEQEVQLTIKCTDDNGTVTSKMTSDNIHVKVNNEEVEPTKKELSEGIQATEVTGANGVQHTLTLSGFEKDGPISLTIDSGVVTDQYENTNDEQNLDTSVTVDLTGPVCTLEEYFPTKTITKDKTLELKIQCTDESEITQDLTSEGIKVTVGDEEETELTKEITNTESIEKGKKYTVEVKGFTKTGKIGTTINESTLQDSLQNTNKETSLDIELEIGKTLVDEFTEESNSTDTPYSDETKDNMFEITQPDGSIGYRYIGNTEKNYVNLLGTDDGKTDTNLWRIIGVFDEENASGVKEKRIKLILDEKLNNTNYSWDNDGTSGSNNWARPSAMNTILNGAFWNGTSGNCPSGANNATRTCDFSSYKMSNVQDKIENMKWHLGGAPWDNNISTESYFIAERSTTVPNGSSATGNGYVGLMYPSDYGYTYSKGISNTCYEKLYNNSSCNSTEGAKSWMWKSAYNQWTITPLTTSTDTGFFVNNSSSANINSYGMANTLGVRPVVYLKSNIGITGGYGTKTEPYTVGEKTVVDLDTTAPTCSISSITPESPTVEDKEIIAKIKCTDDSGRIKEKSKLTSDEIEIKLNGEDASITKEVSNAREEENEIEYTLTLNNFEKPGLLSITIPAGKVIDESGNTNLATSLTVGAIQGLPTIQNGIPSNGAETPYNEETKDKMFEISHPDGRTEYRYIGNTEKNYVNLLGTDDGKTDANLWRIIGVFDDPSTIEGTTGAKKIKLILDEKLNNTWYSWDNNGSSGSNNWNRPAALKTALNDLFWNSKSGNCPLNGNGGTTSCNFASYKMSSVQDKIENMKWYLGAGSWDDNRSTEEFYKMERENTAAGAGGGTTATGYVGLAYLSDEFYTYIKDVDTKCFTTPASCNSGTPSKSWMYKSRDSWWTLTLSTESKYDLFSVNSSGSIGIACAYYTGLGVRPVVYLKSNIGITGGSGTKTDPYTVGTIE